ncbi:MAG: AzlC family ABC transporter permease [Gammaproteobacteria bacterium]|nr:AzlC family ABC transporter permease [Gammaproteobacteria bacterium]
MNTSAEFKTAVNLSLPTFFAYFPLGIVFAVLWLKAGIAGYWAPMMSMFVFAGAVQFVALSMIQEHASILAIVLATSFVAFRNVFYGLSLIERFKSKPKLLKLFLIFGLVDATYGILNAHPQNSSHNDHAFCFYLALLPYLYWVSGTWLGLLIYPIMPEIQGLDFMLTSFFMVLVVDLYCVSRDKFSLWMPVVFTFISYLILPKQYLVFAILLSVIFLYISESRELKTTEDK